MISVQIKVKGIRDVARALGELRDSIPEIEYYARINTAEKAQGKLQQEMKSVFKSPTKFMVNALRVSKINGGAVGREKTVRFGVVKRAARAIPQDTTVVVGFKDAFLSKSGRDSVYETIYPHIAGVPRKPKASEIRLRRAGVLNSDEYLVPSRTAPLDPHGNIRRGVMTQILSDLHTFREAGYNTKKNLMKAGRGKFFVARPGGTKGIFKMIGRGGVGMQMIFLIVTGAPRYRKRFDFYGVGQKEIDMRYKQEFDRVYARYIRKSLSK